MTERVGQQLGNYRLLRVLGQGGFAEVFLGEHLYLERPAAIKVLQVRMDPETQEQFRHEARLIAHLRHPHIVSVLEFGIQEQTPYLVMEYTPGGTLRAKHPRGTRLSFEQIVLYVDQVASALDCAHQQRIIHRDVKPDNLLLNADGDVVLSDFGIAVVQQTLDSLSTQDLAGTPLYMAPEQIQHKPCAASDQYALGVMVYEWLSGEAPFQGAVYAVLNQHLHQPPPSLRERLPDLPAGVEEAVFTALAKDPLHRFASVGDFASALEEALLVTQPLTLKGLTTQQAQGPLVLASVAPGPYDAAATTSPLLVRAPPGEPAMGGAASVPPLPLTHAQTRSTQVKLSLEQSNRQRFLRRVRAFWIEGVLDHSLHGAALIALGLQEQLDALSNPWQLVLQHPDTPPRVFAPGTRITQVYDDANGELLILGAPGSGKTTLLLELARDLLERAEHDEHQLMPVMFPLSSWPAKQLPLTEWMMEELISKYQIPHQLARTWIETDHILPLFDGLDEVETQKRTACIETINIYHQEHPFLPLVVSSRSADYLQQRGRVRLTSAIAIQPLTRQQVDDDLARGGGASWALRVALHQDATLRELAETPLMLSILTLTYHDMPVEELLKGGIAPTRQQIFDRYVDRMLTRRGSAAYQREQTRTWLTWLAKQLGVHHQTVFYLEQMQPDWLSSSRMLRWYERLAVRLPGVLIGILVTLITFTTLGSYFDSPISIFWGGLLGWLLSEGRIPNDPQQTVGRSGIRWQQFFQRILGGILIGMGVWLSYGLNYVLFTGESATLSDRLIFGLSYGLSYGLIFGLCSILLQVFFVKSSTAQSLSQTRSPVERTKWQRLVRSPALHNGLLAWLLVGLSLALYYTLTVPFLVSFGQIYRLHSTLLSFGLSIGLRDGLLSGLDFGLAAGSSVCF